MTKADIERLGKATNVTAGHGGKISSRYAPHFTSERSPRLVVASDEVKELHEWDSNCFTITS